MKLRNILITILLIAIFSLTGCESENNSSQSSSKSNEPQYNVSIAVECEKNLIFSKYNVKVYVNDKLEGTLKHGTTDTYTLSLSKGKYDIKFANEDDESVKGLTSINIEKDETFKYKISCSSSEISVNTITDTVSTDESSAESKEETNSSDDNQSTEESNLTIDNCPELASILSNKAEMDPSYTSFATKYAGKTIEFDGRIDYCTTHENYKTRYDYLVSSGNYDPDHQIGPTFKFENVNYYDLNTDLDTVSVGLNVHIIAKVEKYNDNSGLFFLTPVSITGR